MASVLQPGQLQSLMWGWEEEVPAPIATANSETGPTNQVIHPPEVPPLSPVTGPWISQRPGHSHASGCEARAPGIRHPRCSGRWVALQGI